MSDKTNDAAKMAAYLADDPTIEGEVNRELLKQNKIMYKSGVVKAIKIVNGRTRLAFKRKGTQEELDAASKTKVFYLVLANDRVNPTPVVGKEFKAEYFVAGASIENPSGDLMNAYYQTSEVPEGSQQLNEDEKPIVSSVKIPSLVWVSDPSTLIVCTAMAACQGDLSKFQENLTMIMVEIKKQNEV